MKNIYKRQFSPSIIQYAAWLYYHFNLSGVGHFLQEDAPEAISALIEQFVQMTWVLMPV